MPSIPVSPQAFVPLSHFRCTGLVWIGKACLIPARAAISVFGMHAATQLDCLAGLLEKA